MKVDKLDFAGLYMNAAYDCAHLKVQNDDLRDKFDKLKNENEILQKEIERLCNEEKKWSKG